MSDEKTYLIQFKNGTKQKIVVPADWKVTFGPVVAGNNKGPSNLQMPLALRFYESDTKQRAIFTNVVSFRDMDIKIMEERINVQEKEGFTECEGVRKRTIFQATTKEWVDADEIQKTPALPQDTEMFNTTNVEMVEEEIF